MLKKYHKYIIIGLFILFLWVYLQGTINKVLFQELAPAKIPKEFSKINQWLKKQGGNFKVVWLPAQFNARVLEWARNKKINDFLTRSSGKPTIRPRSPYARLYYLFFETAIDSVPRLDKFFDILNAQYLIFRTDLPEDYSKNLIASLERNPGLNEIDLQKIDSAFFCEESSLINEDVQKPSIKKYFAECGTKRETYLRIFQNKNFAPLFWVPKSHSIVVGGIESLAILNSRENFNPINQGLIFANLAPNSLQEIKNLEFENIIFNNASFDDLLFALIENQYLVELASKTQGGGGEWHKAGSLEPLHGEWHRVIDRSRISNWDFDFSKNLIYTSEKKIEIKVPFEIQEKGEYFLIVRYFQNNKGGRFKLTLDNKETTIETLNFNNKFTTQAFNCNILQKQEYSLTIQNSIGFNAVNLIALVPQKKYQEYQKAAAKILDKNKILSLQKINPEMTIEPLEFALAREGNYKIMIQLKNDQDQKKEQAEKRKREDSSLQKREGFVEMEDLQRQDPEDLNLLSFDDKKYSLNFDSKKNIGWYSLGERFFKFEEKIPLSQKTELPSILTVDDFFVLDQGNLEFEKENSQKQKKTNTGSTSIKVSNLIPKIEVLKGPGVSERRGRLITTAIQVKEYQNFYLEYKFQGKNLKGVDARILFYGDDYDPVHQRTAFRVECIMEDQIGNVEQKKISRFFGTPRDTYYIKIEFKAEPNSEEKSWFEISDFKLFPEEDLSGIDAIALSEIKENQKETVKEINVEVKYQKINPTKYKISFSGNKEEPFILAFAESYDPMWKLKPKPKSKNRLIENFRSLLAKKSEGQSGFPLYSVINGFYIDPQKLKSNELILEYEPQNWFEAGVFLTLTSLVVSSLIFGIYSLNQKRKRSKNT